MGDERAVTVSDAKSRARTSLESLKPSIEAARAFREAAKSEATRRAYASDWRLFSEWCSERGFVSMPAAPEVLCLYLTEMATKLGRKVSTIERARAAISVAHQFSGESGKNPSLSVAVKETMRGIRRRVGAAKRKKTPVLMADMVRMLDATSEGGGRGDVKAARDRALLAVGFTGAFRRAELVAICIEHLSFEEEGVVVHVPRSKTDQEGTGRDVGLQREPGAKYCPVGLLEVWLAVLRAHGVETGAVFRAIRSKRPSKPLASEAVASIVKEYAEKIGRNPDDFAGHSLRRGFITQAVRDGRTEHAIMQQTGHKSVQVMRGYIERGSVFRNNAAKGLWK